MNYKKSQEILEKINKSNSILVNCHRGPDQDSLASGFAMKRVLEDMGRKVTLFSPTKPSKDFDYMGKLDEIVVIEDVDGFSFEGFDLVIILDSADWRQFGFLERNGLDIDFINIDHHPNSGIKAKLEIIDVDASSTSEILYLVFEDWGHKIDTKLGKTILSGIHGDTGVMKYSSTTPRTLQIASDLFRSGVDYNQSVFEITQNYPFSLIKWWGVLAEKLVIDKEHRFVWAAVDNKVFSRYDITASSTSEFSNLIARSIKGTDFCVIMVEKRPKHITLSVRSRDAEFDSSVISLELGGGGHKVASGAVVDGLMFAKAVEKVLAVAKKHAKKTH